MTEYQTHLTRGQPCAGSPVPPLRYTFKNGREYFDWWMSDKVQDTVDENQMYCDGWEI